MSDFAIGALTVALAALVWEAVRTTLELRRRKRELREKIEAERAYFNEVLRTHCEGWKAAGIVISLEDPGQTMIPPPRQRKGEPSKN